MSVRFKSLIKHQKHCSRPRKFDRTKSLVLDNPVQHFASHHQFQPQFIQISVLKSLLYLKNFKPFISISILEGSMSAEYYAKMLRMLHFAFFINQNIIIAYWYATIKLSKNWKIKSLSLTKTLLGRYKTHCHDCESKILVFGVKGRCFGNIRIFP